jgi:hypothetical protein
MQRPGKPLQQAKTVATGCDLLPRELDGERGVGGSSPAEVTSGARRHPATFCWPRGYVEPKRRLAAPRFCRRNRGRPCTWMRGASTTPGAPVVSTENKDLLLQVFHGASRTRTGDLLGAIHDRRLSVRFPISTDFPVLQGFLLAFCSGLTASRTMAVHGRGCIWVASGVVVVSNARRRTCCASDWNRTGARRSGWTRGRPFRCAPDAPEGRRRAPRSA